MKFPNPIVCAAAGLAGWWGMSSWRGADGMEKTDRSHKSRPTDLTAPASTLQNTRSPGAGSDAISRFAAGLGGLSDARLREIYTKVEKWSAGTARAFALALLDARLAPPEDETNPFAAPAPDAPPASNCFRDLAASLKEGCARVPFGDAPVNFGDGGEQVLAEWTALDPAAATAAVLSMPAGAGRAAAVDKVAETIARDDPGVAWDFVRKSGVPNPGEGSARAWLAVMKEDWTVPSEVLHGFSLTQQESLAATFTKMITEQRWEEPPAVSDGELSTIANGIFGMADSPAKLRLIDELTQRNVFGFIVDGLPDEVGTLTPEEDPAAAFTYAHSLEKQLQENPERALQALKTTGTESGRDEDSPAVLTAAAPRLLPQLARTGHVAEAVQLLDRIPDADVRRQSLEAILPAWMDRDPAAARAAFNAAPLTALEREKWYRHPAFLLHPEQ